MKSSKRPKKPSKKTRAKKAPATTALARRLESIVKLPTGATPARAHAVNAQLHQLSAQMSQAMFSFMDLAQEVIDKQHWKALHFQDVDEYFEVGIGFSWRSLRRRLAIREAVHALPKADQREASSLLVKGVGIHRAAILAPVLKKFPSEWRAWCTRGRRLDEDKLQHEVTVKLGAKSRGRAAHERASATVRATGQKALETLIGLMPEKERPAILELCAAAEVAVGQEGYAGFDRTAIVLMHVLWDATAGITQLAIERGWQPKTPVAPIPADVPTGG